MAVTIKNLILSKVAEAVSTSQYTAVNCNTVIDKFTVVNTSANPVTFSAHIVAAGGTAADANVVIKDRPIAAGETYPCPELVGQVMQPNSFLSTMAGTVSALTIRASGREVT